MAKLNMKICENLRFDGFSYRIKKPKMPQTCHSREGGTRSEASALIQ